MSRATIINRIDAGVIVPAGMIGASGKRGTYVFTAEDVERMAVERAAELTAEAARLTAEATR